MSFGQEYKTFESVYFEVGDSIRVDISLVGDPYFREWNVRGDDKEALVNFLKRNPRLKIQVNAHSDTKGTNASNMERSKLRAASIVEWLTEGEKFESARFRHRGWGESRPIISDEEIYAHRDSARYMWDSLQSINRRIVLIIDDVEQRINCAYRSTDNKALGQYYRNDARMMKIGNRFRLDFVAYEEGGDSIVNFENSRVKFEALAAFIHCHPGVNFQLSVHVDSRFFSSHANLTQLRAEALVNLLVEKFTISRDRFLPLGYANSRPIIPDIIINQLSDQTERQDEMHAINNRSELEIVSIGAFNDIANNRNLELVDEEMVRDGILYAHFEHHLRMRTTERFDSLQLICARNELFVRQSKIDEYHWNLSIATNSPKGEYTSVSFLGWRDGENHFISSRSFEVLPIDDPEIYLGDIQLSNADISMHKDKALFASNQLSARYDTSKYFLHKVYPVTSYKIQVGRKKFDENGSYLSKDLMRAIRKAKPDMIIEFDHFVVQEELTHIHELHMQYIKKTKTRKNVLFQENSVEQ
ncbi:MAG: outer membrane protein OmpA-like peptidoglycan-associated protein [Flavobacteriaceae bacterium]|jgi:outer membrane protein OmpA-like peptidoglycan-associated protein